MQTEEVQRLIEAGIPGSQVKVSSNDGSHFDLEVISPEFAGKSPVNKQRMVYAAINEQITSGAIHAVNIKTFTPQEWEKASALRIGQ